MVHLNRIYTKTGDTGETGLGDGTRVRKNSPRVAVCGSVDELNSVLGLLLAHMAQLAEAPLIQRIQNDLFDLGADLCTPTKPNEPSNQCLRIVPQQVEFLERTIDRLNARLKPLASFVLPGGSTASAWCHLARTVCRRAERELVALMDGESINADVLKYLNRLSDLLFVLARIANDDGNADVLWVPGANR